MKQSISFKQSLVSGADGFFTLSQPLRYTLIVGSVWAFLASVVLLTVLA